MKTATSASGNAPAPACQALSACEIGDDRVLRDLDDEVEQNPDGQRVEQRYGLRRKPARARDRQAEKDREAGDRAEQHRRPKTQPARTRGRRRHHRVVHRDQRVRRAEVMNRGDQPGRHAACVFDMIEHVTVNQPGSGASVCVYDDVYALTGRDEDGVFDVLVLHRLGVARDDLLVMSMRVHGVELFGGDVDPANSKALPRSHVERTRRGILFAVEREVILGGALDLPRRDHLEEIVRESALDRPRSRRFDDDRAVETRVEHSFVVMRVINERAGLIGDETVDEVAARRYERLRDAADAVHRDRDVVHAVEVNRIRRRCRCWYSRAPACRLDARRAPVPVRRRCTCSP